MIPDGYDKLEYNFILWEIFSYYLTFEGTGIIFAGYNRNQFFPSLLRLISILIMMVLLFMK